MPQGLSVGRLIRTTVTLSPLAAQRRGFGTLLIINDSDVINPAERVRTYITLEDVAQDFGTTNPAYLAARLYFGQSPRPQQLQIGRWVSSDSNGFMTCGALSVSEQLMTAWTSITDASFTVTLDSGSALNLGGMDFTGMANLNAVASLITTTMQAAGGQAVCAWDGERFNFTSQLTGSISAVSYLTTGIGGTDISAQLKGTEALAATIQPGTDAETPVDAVSILANASAVWFGCMFASNTLVTNEQAIEVAGLIEGLSLDRIYGVTITSPDVLSASVTNDLASQLKALKYNRTFTQYSENIHAVASFMGRAFSVNFAANRSTITLMYKVEPGVNAEYLSETQAQTLKMKNCNVFVNYVNDTSIIQYGVMSSGAYFDEIHGLSWFKDALQNAEYNLLYQSTTKIPQTDAGQNQLIATAAAVCDEAINNGLVAPGQWNADGFGQLQRGDYMPSGYYIYTPPLALQDQSIREQRIAPPLQIALKLAGAFQELDILVSVNR